jgi:hypothetical protein
MTTEEGIMRRFVEGDSILTTIAKWIMLIGVFLLAFLLIPLCMVSRTVDEAVWGRRW